MIQIAFRWRADDGPTLNAGLVASIFQGMACIACKPYIFVIFQGGVRTPSPPSGSAHGFSSKYWYGNTREAIVLQFIASQSGGGPYGANYV